MNPLDRIELPQIQVALDMDAEVGEICDIAEQAYAGGARIIEAGTPAIKRHGLDSLIPRLREAVPDAVIVADLKTMDVGDLEARIAFRAGADVSTVLAIGGRTKTMEAVDEAVEQKKTVLIDFIDVEDSLRKMADLREELKGKEDSVVFCLHRGISEQSRGRGIYEKEELLSSAREVAGDFMLAVAGGVKEGVARNVARAGADICVVGSAIYDSPDPEKTSENILREMRENFEDTK